MVEKAERELEREELPHVRSLPASALPGTEWLRSGFPCFVTVTLTRLAIMRSGSRILAALALLAIGLPYSTPALCEAWASNVKAAHSGCGDGMKAAATLVSTPSASSCDIGNCPSALAAPPGGYVPMLAAQPLVEIAVPELPSLLLGKSREPLTPPPLL